VYKRQSFFWKYANFLHHLNIWKFRKGHQTYGKKDNPCEKYLKEFCDCPERYIENVLYICIQNEKYYEDKDI